MGLGDRRLSIIDLNTGDQPMFNDNKSVALIFNEEKPIPFYGNGISSRDYTYIDDIVNGISCALQYLEGYKIYNLDESHVITLKQIVEVIEKYVGKKAVLNQLPMQPGDVSRTYAYISKAKSEIGYNPKYTFEEGVAKFVEWYKENNLFESIV